MKTVFFFLLVFSAFAAPAAGSFETQFAISRERLLDNMIRSDITPGAVIAAPSKAHPDYFYHWVRDAALTLEAAMDLYEEGYLPHERRQQLRRFFVDHLRFNLRLQQQARAAGSLGEPKFTVDGDVYAYPWGRPQNDGPALRTVALTRLTGLAQAEDWPEWPDLKSVMYRAELPAFSLLKSDLEFVAHHWPDLNFDLWEEVYGPHFYNLMAQRKALAGGVRIARAHADIGAAEFYDRQLRRLEHELERFWNPDRGYIAATHSTDSHGKSHLDVAVMLAVLHSDLYADSPGARFSFTDDRILATFQKLKDAFGAAYAINADTALAPAFGRYIEDTYDGYHTSGQGNPWVLSTAGAAEFLYRLAARLKEESLTVTTLNIRFLTDSGGLKNLRVGDYLDAEAPISRTLRQNLVNAGDGYLQRVLRHRFPDGSLSEQMNRDTGFMQGAPDLTWSHASYLTAVMARTRVLQRHNVSF